MPEPGVCFQRAELYDVVHEYTGEKIAGAAQKRNKQGLLFQGSIWKPALERCDWRFLERASRSRWRKPPLYRRYRSPGRT